MKSLLSSVLDFANFKTLNVMETLHFANVMSSFELVHVIVCVKKESFEVIVKRCRHSLEGKSVHLTLKRFFFQNKLFIH